MFVAASARTPSNRNWIDSQELKLFEELGTGL